MNPMNLLLKAFASLKESDWLKFVHVSFLQGLPESDIEVAKHALSNMLGGLGYFYGRSRIAISDAMKVGYAFLVSQNFVPSPFWIPSELVEG